MNPLVHIMPAYAVHGDAGNYLGTIVPQDDNCRVYTIKNPAVNVEGYGDDDQGDVILRLTKQILAGEI